MATQLAGGATLVGAGIGVVATTRVLPDLIEQVPFPAGEERRIPEEAPGPRTEALLGSRDEL